MSVADGWGEINHKKSINAAAPNVVHAMDAAHLVRTVNAAAASTLPTWRPCMIHSLRPPRRRNGSDRSSARLMLLYLSGKKTVMFPPAEALPLEWSDGDDVPEDSKAIVTVDLVETRVLENLLAAALAPLRGKLHLWAVQDAEFAFS